MTDQEAEVYVGIAYTVIKILASIASTVVFIHFVIKYW